MTIMFRLVAAAAVSIAASLPALAEETKAATERTDPHPSLRIQERQRLLHGRHL